MNRSFRASLSSSVAPQSTRRGWVGLLYGGWLAALALWPIGRALPDDARLAVYVLIGASLLGTFFAFGRLMARNAINAANVEDILLDERLVQIRDAAMRTAYRALYVAGTLVGALLFVLLLTNPLGCQRAFTPDRMFFAYFSLLSAVLLPLVLPTTLIAWTSPDPPIDDELAMSDPSLLIDR